MKLNRVRNKTKLRYLVEEASINFAKQPRASVSTKNVSKNVAGSMMNRKGTAMVHHAGCPPPLRPTFRKRGGGGA